MIFGVLRQVAVRARVGDLLNDAGALDLLAMLKLGFERGIAGGGHRNLFHLSSPPGGRSKQTERPSAPPSPFHPVNSTRNSTPATVTRETGVMLTRAGQKSPVAASLT